MNDADYGWESHIRFALSAGGYQVTKEYPVGSAKRYRHEWLQELRVRPLEPG
jgi:hypothetical protein